MRSAVTQLAGIRPDQNIEGIREAFDHLKIEIKLKRASQGALEQFRQLSGKQGLKIHLGCGPDVRKDWINIDLALNVPPHIEKDVVFINHDLREGLPIAHGSCAFIYSSHFFEHLDLEHGVRLMRDCYNALEPGGTFRIVLPDLPLLFRHYLNGDAEFFSTIDKMKLMGEAEPGTKSIVDYINYGVYQFGEHKQIYDNEKISAVLRQIGFRSVEPSTHLDGIDPDNDLRRQYSFYTEAIK